MLFTPEQTGLRLIPGCTYWCRTRDGDPHAQSLFGRHYTCKYPRGKGNFGRFTGPGESMVLVTPAGDAMFVWMYSKLRDDDRHGVHCSVFRNEGSCRSSEMILEAMRLAWDRWPGVILWTFVNPDKIRSTNPGFCYKQAGWKSAGRTPKGLVVLKAEPVCVS